MFDINVVDLSLGLAPALVVRLLADLGAAVHRVEPASCDPFYEIHSAYETLQRGKQLLTANSIGEAVELMRTMLPNADVCVVGGEDYPGLQWRPDVEELSRTYPELVILDIAGSAHADQSDLPAVEVLLQAYSGLASVQYPDRPMLYAMPACGYGAALQGMVGACAALCEKQTSGRGQVVRSSFQEGALSWLPSIWVDSDRTDSQIEFVIPKGAQPLIMRCKDGRYVHFSLGTANARLYVYNILGIEDPTLEQDPRGLPSLARGARNFFADVDLIQDHVKDWDRDELLAKLWEAGVPADALNEPGEAWDDEQVLHNKTIRRDADGTRRVGLPFRVDFSGSRGPVEVRHAEGDASEVSARSKLPLHGVRIVDMGVFTAGPHASMLLSDLGADVIKVEALTGEPMRASFRQITASSRGKRGLAIDMKSPKGREAMLRLCASADMVHHNFRPGVTKRLGIDAETLQAANPGLIVLENSGYGNSGPKAQRAGLDMILKAFGGHEHYAAGTGNPPVCYRPTTVDFAAGVLGAVASLVAYRERRESGTGAVIETSLMDTALYMMSELVQRADGQFMPLPQLNAAQTGCHASEQLYAAKDGWIAVAARSDEMAGKLLDVLGLEDRIRVPVRAWGSVEAGRIGDAIAGWEAGPLLAALKNCGVWAAPCREDAEVATLRDRSLQEAGMVARSDHPRYGELRQVGSLFSLSRSPMSVKGNPPEVGQHTREVLSEIGYADSEIDEMFEAGVVV